MPLAVDSSALFAMVRPEPDAEAWFDLITELGRHDRLVVCDVVFAEAAPFFESADQLMTRLSAMHVEFDAIQPQSAFLAGALFADYRRAGGPRTSLIPEFLVAAHAMMQANGLIASDRGYLRKYFQKLKIHQPLNT